MAAFPKNVSPGDPLPTDAGTWNAILGAAHAHRQPGRPDRPGAGGGYGGVVEAFALNSTGANLAPYKPCRVTAAGGIDVTADGGPPWQRSPLLTLGVPAATSDYVCVTLEAIPAGAIGRVAVGGAVLCDVEVANAADAFANPIAGTADRLLSATAGQIRLLHKGTGSTQRRCVVYLGDQMPAGGAPGFVFPGSDFNLTAATGVFQTVITSPPLPAGTYLLWGAVVGELNSATPGDKLVARLYGVSAPIVTTSVAGVEVAGTAAVMTNALFLTPTAVTLEAARVFAGGVTTSRIRNALSSHCTSFAWLRMG